MTLTDAAGWLLENDSFLILTHARPDGDTLGSAAALANALRRLGKRAALYPNPEITEKFTPFVSPYIADGGVFEHVVSVDIAAPNLFPQGFKGEVDLAFDHHPSNSGFAGATVLDAKRAACGEIVLALIRELLGEPSQEEADLLYIAISTDTGCFQYANVTEETFLAAAELSKAGADTAGLSRLFFRTFSRGRLKLEGAVYSGLRTFHDGQIVAAVVTRRMIEETGVTENDMDDLAALPGKLAGHEVSLTLRENENGSTRVSLRSGKRVNVSEIAKKFGGGGHAMAAGCTVDAPPEETLKRLLPLVEEALGNG